MVSHLSYLTLLVSSASLFLTNNVDASTHYDYASPPPPHDYYNSPPPPPQDYYNSPPPPYDTSPIVTVVGKVYCHNCRNWKFPSTYGRPLEGAIVKLICTIGNKEYVEYGETKSNGKYTVTIEGYQFGDNGIEGCKVYLHSTPKGSFCNIPTELNKGALMRVISESHDTVVLEAKSMSFARDTEASLEQCEEHHHYKKSPPPPNYHYTSPPPPTNFYASPPPPPYHY